MSYKTARKLNLGPMPKGTVSYCGWHSPGVWVTVKGFHDHDECWAKREAALEGTPHAD